jgi:hypothetical protein
MPDSDARSPRFDPPGSSAPEGDVLPPPGRWGRGSWLLRDETLHRLEILLDEAFRIPFTRIRFGIDGIIGLVPGVGDVLAGLLSLIIPIAAWIRGVPYVTLIRMGVNLGKSPQLSAPAAPPRRAAPPYLERLGISHHARVRYGTHIRHPHRACSLASRVAHPAIRGQVRPCESRAFRDTIRKQPSGRSAVW